LAQILSKAAKRGIQDIDFCALETRGSWDLTPYIIIDYGINAGKISYKLGSEQHSNEFLDSKTKFLERQRMRTEVSLKLIKMGMFAEQLGYNVSILHSPLQEYVGNIPTLNSELKSLEAQLQTS